MTGDRTVIAPPGQRSAQGLAAERVHSSGDQTVLIGPSVPTASTPVLAISLLVVRSEVASMVGQRFAVTGPATRIGRSDAEIVLPDALLSRQHAIVERKPDGVTIHDLGSANGTQVNGFRLEANRPYPLVPGAHVRVGSTVLAVALDADDSLARLADTELDGRYLLLECLHASPKGAMYRAQKKGSHLPVALKLLAPGYSGWSGYRETFASEAEIAAGLQHPHICRLDDHGEAALMLRDRPVRVPFLAYELMAGGSLSERLPTLAELPTATLLGWIRDLASALDHVHRKGLVHGGLKPSAICFDADGNVYLTDFALGKPRSAEGMTIFGAPAYMAPETWQGAGPSAAGDQYALGVVSYLLLTVVLPYEGQEDPKTRERNLHRPPFALHTLAARNCGRRVSPALTSVVNRALAKNAEQRHESVSAFAARLAGAANSAARSGDSHPVFISYERGDSSAWVTLISQALARDHGVRSFVDTSALDRAEKFPPRIRDAIRDCDVFVCVIGPTTLRSEWVRKEIALACRFRKKMVPVLLERFSESADDLKVRSIKDLLHFGGERVLDQQNLYIPEAMQRIARRVMSGLGSNGNDGDEDGAPAR